MYDRFVHYWSTRGCLHATVSACVLWGKVKVCCTSYLALGLHSTQNGITCLMWTAKCKLSTICEADQPDFHFVYIARGGLIGCQLWILNLGEYLLLWVENKYLSSLILGLCPAAFHCLQFSLKTRFHAELQAARSQLHVVVLKQGLYPEEVGS